MRLAKILYTISIFVITGFVILFSMGCRLTGLGGVWNRWNFTDSKIETYEQETEAFKNIDIDANMVNFKIEEGSGYMVKSAYPSKFDTEISVKDETLVVKVKVKDGFDFDLVSFGNGISDKKCNLTVVIPKGNSANMGDLKLVSNAGNIELEDLSLGKIDIDCDAANIEMNNIKGSGCRIDTDAGNVQLRSCDLGDLAVETNAGNIEFDKTVMKDLEIKTNMGNIDLDDVTFGKGKIESDVGNIAVEGEYAELKAESDVGAINVSSDNKDTRFDLDTDIGAVSVNGRSKGRSYSN
ncbi:MAG: DUF4097 family beta strand repeat protein [Clostridiales bacterium]|nr:DUF4097 family beta strand repeat protein [Clostridiales bacterium]